MTSPDAATPTVRTASRRRGLSRAQRVGLGLLLTFVGFFLLIILMPTDPTQFGRVLPVAAAGLLALWLGGVLMGRARAD